MNFKLRSLEKADIPQLFSLIKTLAAYEKKSENVTNSITLMEEEFSFYDGVVAGNNHNQLVGAAIFYFDYSTYVGKSLHIEDLIVLEDFRGMQIGTELMKATIQYAKEQNCKRIRWQVLEWNTPAKAFYQKFKANLDDEFSICSIDL